MPLPELTEPADAAERQRLFERFKSRRNREIVAWSVMGLAGLVAATVYHQPATSFAGLSGLPLIYALLGVFTVGLLHHMLNWRCPRCNEYLSRCGWNGGLCRKCRASFYSGPGVASSEPAARAAQNQQALQGELQKYAYRYHQLGIVSLGMAALGAARIVVGIFNPVPLEHSGAAYQRALEPGPDIGTIVVGCVLLGVGTVLFILSRRALKTGFQRFEAKTRQRLGMDGG